MRPFLERVAPTIARSAFDHLQKSPHPKSAKNIRSIHVVFVSSTDYGVRKFVSGAVQLEPGETCSSAEATRGHYARVLVVLDGLKLADLGITTEPRGLTGGTIQTGRSLCFRCCPRTQRGSGCVCGLLHCSTSPRETLRKQLLIVKSRMTGIKFLRSRHPLPPACLDSRWATAPCSHPDPAACSRHRIQP